MSNIVKVKIRVDDTQFRKAKLQVAEGVRQMMTALRRATRVTVSLVQAVGVTVDEVMRLTIESALLTAEYISSAIASQSLLPGGAFKTGAMLGSVMFMLLQINALKKGRTEIAQQFGYAEQTLSYFVF